MNITATLKVKFRSEKYDVAIDYNTYVKAPYDTYLITSLFKATNGDEEEIYQYIDDITGDGSLNEHFRKLYDEVKGFTKAEIDSILKSSLFPVKETDNSNHFLYYPEFDVSQLNGRFYSGNLNDNLQVLKEALVDEDDEIRKFVQMKIEKDEYSSDSNILSLKNMNITDNSASFRLKGLDNPIVLTIDQLMSMALDKLSIDINHCWYDGGTVSDGLGDNWYILTDQAFNDFEACSTRFYDQDYIDAYFVYPSHIEKLEILEVKKGFYFYKKTSYIPPSGDQLIYNQALNYLVTSKKINEFKTTDVLKYLKVASPDYAIDALSYLLSIRDSDQLASCALQLIKNGHSQGWSVDSLRRIKDVCKNADYELLYPINDSLDWTKRELIYIPDEMLTPEHKMLKNDYRNDINFYKSEITNMLGVFSAKGVREGAKKLGNKDQLVKDFNKFLNEYLGHNNVDILDIDDLDELKKHYDKIKNVYDNQYPTILKRLDALKNGGN